MSRDNDRTVFSTHSDTADGNFVKVEYFPVDRPFLVQGVSVIGGNPADADGDTVAIDVSYSTDGFSSSDVEVAVDAAAEYNDTDNDQGYSVAQETDLTLTAANVNENSVVRVPAGAVIRHTVTWTGDPADGALTLSTKGVFI